MKPTARRRLTTKSQYITFLLQRFVTFNKAVVLPRMQTISLSARPSVTGVRYSCCIHRTMRRYSQQERQEWKHVHHTGGHVYSIRILYDIAFISDISYHLLKIRYKSRAGKLVALYMPHCLVRNYTHVYVRKTIGVQIL